ncbi:unnamed protein product [Durusdinium trenchii]|uniref:RING-type domain-containing protein n=1 Tax=Durusdinium trenchii TaxID=1381693 RepID=A0ABP0RFS8_9DINO
MALALPPCPECKSTASLVALDTAYYCRACSISRCLSCHNMWNADHRCATSVALSKSWEGFKDLAEFEIQLKPMGFKRCPACQYPCEKEDPASCDHITCECGHEFCWLCGEDRRVIYAHDNSYHHPSCKFYIPCDEKPKLEKKCPRCKETGVPCMRPSEREAAKKTNQQKEALGLYVKNWRKTDENDAALVSEKTEAVPRSANPFGMEVFSQMFCGGPLASCCRVLGTDSIKR